MKSQFKFVFAAIVSLAAAPIAFSQAVTPSAAAAVDTATSHGEVKKVDEIGRAHV